MAEEPLRIVPDEITVDEIIDHLHDGRRVIIEREFLGTVHEVALRFDGDTYYCDTPTTLHRHQTIDGMRDCLLGEDYGRA